MLSAGFVLFIIKFHRIGTIKIKLFCLKPKKGEGKFCWISKKLLHISKENVKFSNVLVSGWQTLDPI